MAYQRRMKKNPGKEEIKEFQEEVIQVDRVTRVVKGGRRLRFRATVVIGDLKGRVGLGIGKSNEVVGAIRKAITKAKKNMLRVPIYNGTIPHEIKTKFKSSKVIFLPACEGTGIIAGGAARKIIELSGIKNIISKSLGSSNRINNAKATIKALESLQKLPKKQTDAEKTEKEKQSVEIRKEKSMQEKKYPAKKMPTKGKKSTEEKPENNKKESSEKNTKT